MKKKIIRAVLGLLTAFDFFGILFIGTWAITNVNPVVVEVIVLLLVFLVISITGYMFAGIFS